MKPSADPAEFVRSPLGRSFAGPTYVIWCEAPDLIGSIQWGAMDARMVREMLAVVDFLDHPDLAPRGRVLMDCRGVERVDPDALLAFMELARDRLPRWSPRIERHAVVLPGGVSGILLAGALPSLSPEHPLRFVQDLEDALAFVDHPAARSAHAAAWELAQRAGGRSELLERLRAHLARDLSNVTVEQCAIALGLSVRTLQRELGRLGTSFSDELRRSRVAVAEVLLASSDLKIDAIAARVGFGTSSRLSVALRRDLQVTPSELRARARRRSV